jgi:hypothetical protein
MGAYPRIVDWNEDGKKDLLVGDAFGFMTVYLNTGTNDNPTLTTAGRIKVGSNDYNEGEKATPVVNDWNEDGKKDLIVGAEDGRIRLLLNKGTNNNPVFNSIQYVQANGVDLDVSPLPDDRSAPEVADLDGDGLKDLIIGQRTGMIYFYSNSGTNANPVFTTRVNLQADGADIKMGGAQDGYSRLDIVDWDGDSDLDLLVGEFEGFVTLFRSTLNPMAVREDIALKNVPLTFSLSQNYPNPFNPGTTIKFYISQNSPIKLSIYNTRGQLQAVLADGYRQAGWHEATWDASKNVTGIYFARLEANNSLWQIKMCVVK